MLYYEEDTLLLFNIPQGLAHRSNVQKSGLIPINTVVKKHNSLYRWQRTYSYLYFLGARLKTPTCILTLTVL